MDPEERNMLGRIFERTAMERSRESEEIAMLKRIMDRFQGDVYSDRTPGELSQVRQREIAMAALNYGLPMPKPEGPALTYTQDQYNRFLDQHPVVNQMSPEAQREGLERMEIERRKLDIYMHPERYQMPAGSMFGVRREAYAPDIEAMRRRDADIGIRQNVNALARGLGDIYNAPDFRAAVYPYLVDMGLAVGKRR